MVVIGDTGGIGAGLVAGFLAADTKVVVSAKSEASVAQLRHSYSGNQNLHCPWKPQ